MQMLTPIDIQKKTFRSGIGYDKKDVESFLSEVYESYEKLYKDNMESQEKIANLTNMLHNYKVIEKSLQKALVLAQKAADETKETARASADAIEADAHARARDIISNAKQELEEIRGKTKALMAQYKIYKMQYRQIIQTQMELLENDSFQPFEAAIKKAKAAKEMEEKKNAEAADAGAFAAEPERGQE